ncbi:RsmB/NOP family class I SAM-dependent RNA methyltransferase [Actibacterium sp. 188UL27-1]|uniref:RsmB/NOP family class I SAM-dependent RNA methyltransferase n=1 Tax=Actibacterium sp. 188UL27-1 TaxID=2786961 RepID=UPI001958023E|nr:transcription antitermination factor NusB [Actibacterium sp. 188UL27-1]MBM7068511.1 methyltransferase domain-containing protein [Actibacterium sp. 188UL27-1]
MAQNDKQIGLAPRAAALDLLQGVIEERRMLSDLVADPVFAHHPPAVKAAAQRLAVQTLRQRARADAMLKPYLQRPPAALARLILQLGVTEMIGADEAPHGVVNAAVALARQRRPGAAAFVNAVLRKVAEADRAPWAAAAAPRLPNWLRGRLSAAYGNAHVARMETAHEAGAPLDLTVRDPAQRAALAEALEAEILPTGSLRIARSVQVSALPGFETGAWWVQDAAAAVPATLLAAGAGERVLDLCAAPGGKTMQLSAAGAKVTALDMSGPRLERVQQNLDRVGLSADVITADALHWEPELPFDAILLDAPCSATGTLRRHPDLPFAKDATAFKSLFELQAQLIDRAVAWLAPGGRLVFCTCSLLPQEGEVQLAAALDRHAGLRIDELAMADLPEQWRAKDGGLRLTPDLWPDLGGLDGFFIAVLRRETTTS